MLQALASKGHLQVTVESGKLHYSISTSSITRAFAGWWTPTSL
jgi:hypothetical protein